MSIKPCFKDIENDLVNASQCYTRGKSQPFQWQTKPLVAERLLLKCELNQLKFIVGLGDFIIIVLHT